MLRHYQSVLVLSYQSSASPVPSNTQLLICIRFIPLASKPHDSIMISRGQANRVSKKYGPRVAPAWENRREILKEKTSHVFEKEYSIEHARMSKRGAALPTNVEGALSLH